jgi:hypothetical protein
VALAGRDGGHLGFHAGLAERAEHERPVQVGDPVVRDHRHVRVADRLQQPFDRLLRQQVTTMG